MDVIHDPLVAGIEHLSAEVLLGVLAGHDLVGPVVHIFQRRSEIKTASHAFVSLTNKLTCVDPTLDNVIEPLGYDFAIGISDRAGDLAVDNRVSKFFNIGCWSIADHTLRI